VDLRTNVHAGRRRLVGLTENERVPHADVRTLRDDARRRACARAPLPFDGVVDDVEHDGVPMRRYRPLTSDPSGDSIVFLHGGYGVLGDLDIQDGYCRRLGTGLGLLVLSVDYRLAPEANLDESADDAVTAVRVLHRAGARRVVLCGDSAGGAVALRAARRASDGADVDALLLTNPNVDLTLSTFDDQAPGGPDRELSAWAFRTWARVDDLGDAPDLSDDVTGLPPTLVAVGSLDALLPEARTLAHRCGSHGVRCELVEVAGAAHGFMGDPDARAATEVVRVIGAFLA
jgi:acetyl esterase